MFVNIIHSKKEEMGGVRISDVYENCYYVYLGNRTIFVVKHHRIVGMILLYTEMPLTAVEKTILLGRVKA